MKSAYIPARKPFSQACENNKRAILSILQRVLAGSRHVLEIGSGTGQHAVYFAEHLPHLTWQTSDLVQNHEGIRAWIDGAALGNVRPPVALDVTDRSWPITSADGVFSANTAHIMSWPVVEAFIAGVGELLEPDGFFCLYGPFNYGGLHTSESNARFDLSLRTTDPVMGVRDFEAIDATATAAGLRLMEDNEMPANNRLLVWCKDG